MNQQTPEITFKALILGIILSMVLAGANAYLGLFAGMTVTASIPAAVMSMGILSIFKKSNILENNIVQTAASAGAGGYSRSGSALFTSRIRGEAKGIPQDRCPSRDRPRFGT